MMAELKAPEKNSSTLKAVAVLRAVANATSPITLLEISRVTGFPMSVCHRFLASLQECDFVQRSDDDSGYLLGYEMLHIGRQAQAQNPVRRRITSLMYDLTQETGDTGILMVPDGRSAVCVDRIEGSYPIRITGTQVGIRTPLHCGCAPFAILAFSPDDFIRDYLQGDIPSMNGKTITDPIALMERIEMTRRLGYSVGDEDLFDQVVAVGVPIFDDQNRLIAGMSLGGIKQRYDLHRIDEIGKLLLQSKGRGRSSL